MLPEENSLEFFHKRLSVAVKHDSLVLTLETLLKVADFWRVHEQKPRALELVGLVRCYPMPMRLKERAEQLWLMLVDGISWEEVSHVSEWTEAVTLDEVVESILNA